MFYLYVNGELISVCERFSEVFNTIFYDVFDNIESDVHCWIHYMVDDLLEKKHTAFMIGDFHIEVWYG